MTVTQRPKNLHDTLSNSAEMRDTFREDVIDGLTKPPGRKAIPAKHLYDAAGSRLFEQICDLPEYYPTRTEESIYREHIDSITRTLGAGVTLIEPGSGSGEKSETLLSAMDGPARFVPIEISPTALEDSALHLAERFPSVDIHPVCADFTTGADVLDGMDRGRRVLFFPGSTIGNLVRAQRRDLLSLFARMVGPGGRLLLGFDLIKDRDVLHAAYNDRAGVTAAFNLNLLKRINTELGANFDRSAFHHDAPWNEEESRIEMHIVSERDQRTRIDGREIRLRADEHVHTENSHKFTPQRMEAEAAEAGFSPIDRWTDENEWFCVGLFEAA